MSRDEMRRELNCVENPKYDWESYAGILISYTMLFRARPKKGPVRKAAQCRKEKVMVMVKWEETFDWWKLAFLAATPNCRGRHAPSLSSLYLHELSSAFDRAHRSRRV